MAAVGLEDKLQSRIGELSHGQRQLLAIEMALLRRPALLLLDEHTASLDRRNAEKCMEATNRLCRETVRNRHLETDFVAVDVEKE